MDFTPKQERNGATGDSSERTTGPGPMPDIPMEEATAAGMAHYQAAKQLFDSPAGSGVGGHHMATFEWESGSISEMEGEA